MTSPIRLRFLAVSTLLATTRIVSAQTTAAAAAAAAAPPPPATKLEAFKPGAGSVLTLGYNELGKISGVSVDSREMRDSKGGTVRGVLVEVKQSEYREERAFIDADELPELIKGFDALLAVKSNPTAYKNFEVRYTTKGELQLTAFNNSRGSIQFAVQTGRVLHAQVFLDDGDMRKLQGMFQTAQQQLGAK